MQNSGIIRLYGKIFSLFQSERAQRGGVKSKCPYIRFCKASYCHVKNEVSQETRNVSMSPMAVWMEWWSFFEEKTLRVFPSIDRWYDTI